MKRDDLHPDLAKDYSPERGYGTEKIDHPDFQNIFFVVPKPLPTTREHSQITQAMTHSLSKAYQALNSTKSLEQMDGIDRLISRLVMKQEALSSSRIEGTFSTIDEVFSAQTEEKEAKPDTLSVLGYAKALSQILETVRSKREAGVTLELFQDIHKMIVSPDTSYAYIPGQFRSLGLPHSVVQIGGLRRKEESTYNPAPPAHVGWLMNSLVSWLSDSGIREEGDAGIGLPLPLRMALAHAHFEAIHPFPDGNGRVGRLIWPVQMILSDLAPIHLSSFIEAERQGYYDGLKAYQQKLDICPLLDYLGDALKASKHEEEQTKIALKKLLESWQERLSARRGSSAEKILPLLLEWPILGIEEVQQSIAVSLQTASSALQKLESEKIIIEKTGRLRRRKWSADEVLTILKRPFGMSPDDALHLAEMKAGRS